MNFMELEIAGISLLLLIPGIVECAKNFGVQGKASLALSIGLGFFFVALARTISSGLVPVEWLAWIEVVVVGLAGSMAASGYYDLVRRTGLLRD